MEVLESPETVNLILEKWFLTSRCCLQSSGFRSTEATNLVVWPFVEMLYVFSNNFLNSEVALFYSGKKFCKRALEVFKNSFLHKEMRTSSML